MTESSQPKRSAESASVSRRHFINAAGAVGVVAGLHASLAGVAAGCPVYLGLVLTL